MAHQLIVPVCSVDPARAQAAGCVCQAIPTDLTTVFQFPNTSQCQNYKYIAKAAPGWQFVRFRFEEKVEGSSSWEYEGTRYAEGTYDATSDQWVLETLARSDGQDAGGHNYVYWLYRCPFWIDATYNQAWYSKLDVYAEFRQDHQDHTHLLVWDDTPGGSGLLVYDDRTGSNELVADY